jgi:hypothetical protein
MPKVTLYYKDAHGNAKQFDLTGDQFDFYESRAMAEAHGRQITGELGGADSSPMPVAAMMSAGAPGGAGGGARGSASTMGDHCILVNGVVICGK